MRDKVNALETAILTLPQVEMPLTHHFAPGIYAREMFVPKGGVLTGRVHKFTHLSIMSKGDLSVVTEDGVIRVQAPFTLVAPAGTKRAMYAHEDTVWTVILPTTETDVDKIEELFTAGSDEEYLAFCEALKLEEVKCLS